MQTGRKGPKIIRGGLKSYGKVRGDIEIASCEGRKVSAGPLIAGKLGLPALRKRCPHFNRWVSRLEELGSKAAPS